MNDKTDKKEQQRKGVMENKNLLVALVKAQLEISPPVKDKENPRFKSRYASLDSMYNSCREVLAKNGLSLMHDVEKEVNEETKKAEYNLKTTLMHVSGESLSNNFPMFVGEMTSQGLASARTYACRYATANLLALPSDDDDDGEQAVTAPKLYITPEQEESMLSLIGKDVALLSRVLEAYKVDKLNKIQRSEFGTIVARINSSKGASK